jgi:uncharacterized membrane protein
MPSHRLTWLARPENAFTVITLVFGLALLVATPPFQTPDEYAHFYRAYDVSEGHVTGNRAEGGWGAWLPSSLTDLADSVSRDLPHNPDNKQDPEAIIRQFNKPLAPETRAFTDFRGTSLYSPIPYIPQALGIAYGRAAGCSPILLTYLGRLTNLLLYIVLTGLAIRLMPIGKRVLTIVALTPMVLSQAASLSTDASTYALAFVVTAAFLRAAFDHDAKLHGRDLLALGVLCAILLLCKPAYVALTFLYFAIPLWKVGSLRDYVVRGVLVVAAVSLPAAAWTMWAQDHYLPYQIYDTVRPGDQLALVLSRPWDYLRVMLWTYGVNLTWFTWTFIGVLGWLDIFLQPWVYFSFAVVLPFVGLTDGNRHIALSTPARLLFAAVVSVTCTIVLTTMYFTWTPLGARIIEGVQGRYFIPVAPLLLLLLHNRRIRPLGEVGSLVLWSYLCLVLTATVIAVVARFYVV